jgi:hypothetical protein
MEVELHAFLTTALDEGEWSASRPGCFTFDKKEPRYPLGRRQIYVVSEINSNWLFALNEYFEDKFTIPDFMEILLTLKMLRTQYIHKHGTNEAKWTSFIPS